VSVNLPWFSKNAVVVGAVALSVGVLAACSSSSSSNSASSSGSASATSGTITIGASLSTSGDFAPDGQAYEQGYKLWASDVNAAGGIDGRKVALTILNDASSPNQVVTNYQTLINTDHVALTFGPFSSLLTTPASAVAAHNGYAFIEGAGGAPSVFQSPANQADHNVFDVSLPVADSLMPFVDYIQSLGSAADKKLTAAYPMANDPFATSPVQVVQQRLQALGVKTVYTNIFPEEPASYKPAADQVALKKPDIVVLGSTDPGTVASFMSAFEQDHFSPKMFIAAAGPDQGSDFLKAIGKPYADADGIMVGDGWYSGFVNASSEKMVSEYMALYHVPVSGVQADIAEAYSVGQVAEAAIKATGGTDNQKIISYLHSGVTIQTVQGSVKFDSLGENSGVPAFIMQWQDNATEFNQVLPATAAGSKPFIATKPNWAS